MAKVSVALGLVDAVGWKGVQAGGGVCGLGVEPPLDGWKL